MRKEYVFRYEREYRFVMQLNNVLIKNGYYYHLGNPDKLPFYILINPLLKKAHYIAFKKKIEGGKYHNKFMESKLTKWLKPELW